MRDKIKIHIESTGQDTFARVAADSIRGLPSCLVVRIYDIYPILKPFPMFSKIRYLGIEKEFYCADGNNLLIARDTMSVDDWIRMLENAKIEKESEEKSMLHNVTVKHEENKVLEKYWVMRAFENKPIFTIDVRKPDWIELDHEPTPNEIAQFLSDSKADFVSVAQNYRFENELPFC